MMKKIIYVILFTCLVCLFLGCTDEDTYKVTFIVDGEIFKTETLKYEEQVDFFDIEKEGYDFLGWLSDDNLFKKDSVYIVYNNTTFTAQFLKEEPTYKVYFHDDNDSLIDTKEVKENQSATTNVIPTKDGYIFSGWSEDLEIIDSDLDVYPLFTPISYNINYFHEGTKITLSRKTYTIESNFTLPRYEKEGYTFLGWFLDEELTIPITKIEKGRMNDLNLYLKMEIKKQLIVDAEEKTIEIGESTQLFITEDSLNTGVESTLTKYEITTSNDNIITVSKEGLINANSCGSATITIRLDDLVCTLEIVVIFKKTDDIFDKTNDEVLLRENVLREMTNPYYWINRYPDNDKLILSYEEISEFNYKCLNNIDPFNNKTTGFVDITKINESATKEEITKLVKESMNISPTTTYNNNCNIDSIVDTTLKFGLTVNVTSMKNTPTLQSTGTNNKYQETALEVGEGVVIYHISKDQKFYFVQAYNYRGWVEKDNIALCTKTQMLDYINQKDFIMVTCERLTSPRIIRMGTKIPLVKQDKDVVTILLPNHTEEGTLELKEYDITIKDENISIGYLQYTTKSLIKQMFKMLGEPYDWGDEHLGRDCSSTVDAAFKCFGFIMPRNTSSLCNLNGIRYDVSNKSISEKETILKSLNPGTLILKSGHIMFYLGQSENKCYIIHNISGGVTITTCEVSSYSFTNYNLYIQMSK